MHFLKAFSKAIGALGGGAIGGLIGFGFYKFGHPLDSTTTAQLTTIGSVIATVLAPKNSVTEYKEGT